MEAMRQVLATLVAVGALAGAAAADDAADRKAKAAALVDAASAAQAASDYATAIAKLREAYDLIPHPALLYNLGQAYRLSEQPWDAIEQYQRYLAVEPKGPFAASARQHLAKLKKATAGKPRPVAVTPVEPPPVEPPPVTAPPPVVEPPPPAPTLTAPSAPAPIAHRGGGWRRPTALALTVGGLAGVGAGVYFGLHARALSDELSSHDGPWTNALLAKQDEGRRAETLAIVGWAAGGALVVGGAILFAVDRRARSGPAEVALVPSLSPSTVGLTVRGAL